jgi:flagellar basal-body rod protein FlgB
MFENLALLNGLTQKMEYLQVRQRVIAQNLTQANTPGYKAHDVAKPDFAKTLSTYESNIKPLARGEHLSISQTSDGHFTHRQLIDRREEGNKMRKTYDVTPSENSVNIEEQMMSASQTAIDYQLISNIYDKNMGLLRAAMSR